MPKNTTARAVQPIPLEIFVTKDEILRLKMQPANAPAKPAIPHAIRRIFVTSVPFACKTGASLPQILM